MYRVWFAMLLVCLPCFGAEPDPHQEWLEFKTSFAEYASGPTGFYAIQDMRELAPGERAHLPRTSNKANARWSEAAADADLAAVRFRDGKALLSGPGLDSGDLLQRKKPQQTLSNGLIVGATQYDGMLKLWLYNPERPKTSGFEGLRFHPYVAAGVIEGRFQRKARPVGVNHLDSREHSGLMYWIGDVHTAIAGKPYTLRAFNYSQDWDTLDHLLLFLRDRTSGRTSYGGGRVLEIHFPKDEPPETVRLNLNLLYSFLCAHSDAFNCPVNLTDFVDAELRYGEIYPPQRPEG